MEPGSLEVVCGPMFSGKTSTLIRRVHSAQAHGMTVAVLKPVVDTRHDESAVYSHDGTCVSAQWIERDARSLPQGFDLIAIDEVQFLSFDAVPNIMEAVVKGAHVVAAGLDLTFRGEPFGPVPALLTLADRVTKLTGECVKCGRESTRTQRRGGVADTVLVGGAETYEPRCLSCFDPKGGA